MARKSNNPFEFDFSQVFGQMNVPNMDMGALVESQRRNFEALAQAQQLAAEGLQAIAQRQTEVVREAVEQAVGATREVMAEPGPQAQTAKQMELAKTAMERSVSNMREISEMVAKSNQEAFDVLNKRFYEVMDEIKSAAKK